MSDESFALENSGVAGVSGVQPSISAGFPCNPSFIAGVAGVAASPRSRAIKASSAMLACTQLLKVDRVKLHGPSSDAIEPRPLAVRVRLGECAARHQFIKRPREVEAPQRLAHSIGREQVGSALRRALPPAGPVAHHAFAVSVRIRESSIAVPLDEVGNPLHDLPPLIVAPPAQGSPGVESDHRRLYRLAFRPAG